MKAVILCGGKGTRIRDVSEHIPKPLLPIGDMPILWHIMKLLSCHGINDFILCLGYKGELIKDFFLNYHTRASDITINLGSPENLVCHDHTDEKDWTITLANTGEETQTAGRLAKVRKYLEGEDHFILTYGDGVANIDIPALLAFHRDHGKTGTLTAVRAPSRFGEITLDDGILMGFEEKPTLTRGHINGGFMVFDNSRIWDGFPGGDESVLEQHALPPLIQRGELAAYAHEGFWHCMDSIREYNSLNRIWKNGNAPWRIW